MGNCCKKQQYIYKEVFFKDVIKEIKPFDLILFRGSGILSETIKILEESVFGNDDWTHVGVIITTDYVPIYNGVQNKLYIWESVGSVKEPIGDNIKSIETKEGFIGVQIRELEEVVDKYLKNENQVVGWCKLRNNPIDKKLDETNIQYYYRIEKIRTILRNFHEENCGTVFPLNPLYMLPSIYPELEGLRKIFTEKQLFCSQFASLLYITLGLVDKSINPADISPVEMLGFGNDNFPDIFIKPPIIFK